MIGAELKNGTVYRLGGADQQTARRLSELSLDHAFLFASRGLRLVLTHAYDGGYPDPS
jgi:hypothetical protein